MSDPDKSWGNLFIQGWGKGYDLLIIFFMYTLVDLDLHGMNSNIYIYLQAVNYGAVTWNNIFFIIMNMIILLPLFIFAYRITSTMVFISVNKMGYNFQLNTSFESWNFWNDNFIFYIQMYMNRLHLYFLFDIYMYQDKILIWSILAVDPISPNTPNSTILLNHVTDLTIHAIFDKWEIKWKLATMIKSFVFTIDHDGEISSTSQ